MANLGKTLDLDRCPYCRIDQPNLNSASSLWTTTNDRGTNERCWKVYKCARCGGLVLAQADRNEGHVHNYYPGDEPISGDVPEKARDYLRQARDSIHAPAGAVLLAASAVDAMLKARGLAEGSLYGRINTAAEDNLITEDMAAWAHEVRLDSNDQRHADEDAELPTSEDAERSVEFASALATFLFVLPARVRRGRRAAEDEVDG